MKVASAFKAMAIVGMTLQIMAGCMQPKAPPPPVVLPATMPAASTQPAAVALSDQRAKAYPEIQTNRYICLADFEDSPASPGHAQVESFSIDPDKSAGLRKFTATMTRTGVGAMEATLSPKAELVLAVPLGHDFGQYTLLAFALNIDSYRDDLTVSVSTDKATWTSPKTLVQPGWSNVLVDIRALSGVRGFDPQDVRTIRIRFNDLASAVTFRIDDLMLVDNRRQVTPAPPGIKLSIEGLDYKLSLPGWNETLELARRTDGLWALGAHQPKIQLASAGEQPPNQDEYLAGMGERMVGAVELAEHNDVRVRFVSTWYFPTRAGEWVSLAMRGLRWEYTFYEDGRYVVHLQLNNVEGRELDWVKISLPNGGAWHGQPEEKDKNSSPQGTLLVRKLPGPSAKWSCMVAPVASARDILYVNYLNPPRVEATLAQQAQGPGDEDRDGFDESQGCYVIVSAEGNCRLRLPAGGTGIYRPVFRIEGKWGQPQVNSEGMAIRKLALDTHGAMLFMVPGLISRQAVIEVSNISLE